MFWQEMLLALWLLSQTLGFALPALPPVADQEALRCPTWRQNQSSDGYDASSQTRLLYDAKLPAVTTGGLSDLVAEVQVTFGYDSVPVCSIRIVGPPRAPTIGKARFLAAKRGTMFSSELGSAGHRASAELLDAMRAQGRTVTIAGEVLEGLRFLNAMGTEASLGGPGHLNILLRPNPSRAAAMEEFLHGSQDRLGIINRLGLQGAECHVTTFVTRHRSLLGLLAAAAERIRKFQETHGDEPTAKR